SDLQGSASSSTGLPLCMPTSWAGWSVPSVAEIFKRTEPRILFLRAYRSLKNIDILKTNNYHCALHPFQSPGEIMLLRISLSIVLATMLFFFFVSNSNTASKPQYDLLIRNGLVVDGSGTPGRIADVAVNGDR